MSDERAKGDNRREHKRHPVTRLAWYRTIEPMLFGEDGEARPIEGLSYSVDVSRGGLGLVTTNALEQNSLVMVQVVFESDATVLSAVCRVAFCGAAENAGYFRLGLQFVVLPPDAAGFIAEHYK
jgi:c-di-GMP-binding flagellar brake protein YcgR